MKRAPLFSVFLIVLVDMLAMMMIVPLLPFYAQRFGASALSVGFLASSFAVCQLFAAPLLGRLSDRVGRKPVLIASQVGTLAGFLLMAFANSLWLLFAARIIDGITAGNLPLAQACITDLTKPEERAKAFGIIGIAFGIGLVLGPAASGLLAAQDWSYPMYAASLLSAVSIVVTALFLPSVKPVAEEGTKNVTSFAGFFSRPELGPLLGQFSVYVVMFGLFTGGLALFTEGRFAFGPTEVGYAFAYCGLLGVFIQGFLLGKLVPRFGEKRLVQAAFALDILGYACLALSTGIGGLILACTFFSFGNSLLRPVLTSLISKAAGANEQGAVLGCASSLQSLGQTVAPPLGGLLIDRGQFTAWALCLAAVSALGLASRKRVEETRPVRVY